MQSEAVAEKVKGPVTGKRRAVEDLEEGAKEGRRELKGAAGFGEEEGLLPGPKFGSGPVWRLPAGEGASEAERDGEGGALFRCGGLLEQALSCSEHADVRFVFDDGESGVGGHRGMLCCVSGEFQGMFGSGMAEAKSGEVRVRGAGRASFRGFLEFLYLGRAGKEMGLADGREVWMLADMYDVQGVKDWLMGEALGGGGVCAVVQYTLEGEGFLLSELLEACKGHASSRKELSWIGEEGLRGVSAEAARVVLEAFLAKGHWGSFVNGRMVEGFRYVERWARANGGLCYGSGDVSSLVGLLDLGEVCLRDLMEVVRPSGLLREEDVDGMYEARLGGGRLEGRRLGVIKSFGDTWSYGVAASSVGGAQRVAVLKKSTRDLCVHDVTSGASVYTLRLGEEPGRLTDPCRFALSDQGELVVSDSQDSRLLVFDRSGGFVCEIGTSGEENERLNDPVGVALTGDGDIIVADFCNHRVVVYRMDGTFVRSIGSFGRNNGQFQSPLAVAVGADGRIVVADHGNARVQVLSADGSHVLTIGSRGNGTGLQLMSPVCVAVNVHGEILVSDSARQDMQLFSSEGVWLQCFGKGDISGVDVFTPGVACFDSHGRVFVCDEHSESVLMLT